MFPALESSLCHQTNSSLLKENVSALWRPPQPSTEHNTDGLRHSSAGGWHEGEQLEQGYLTTTGAGGSLWHQNPLQMPP